MSEAIVLFGAGAAGRWALSHLRSRGIEPLCFVDSDPKKWNTAIDGVKVCDPKKTEATHHATWVACSIQHDFAVEIRADMSKLGVKSKPLWEVLPVCHGVPSLATQQSLLRLFGSAERGYSDETGVDFLYDQIEFRKHPNYDAQIEPSSIAEIYFPDFILHREDEHFVDCGAARGDTVTEFLSRWPKYEAITALEPDPKNYRELETLYGKFPKIDLAMAGVSDHSGIENFTANGDFSSHLDNAGGESIVVERIDNLTLDTPPTYIKMDIEGAELEALWGARRILKEHSPVLAVCAYHTSDHLWQIPLLIHAIQPDYKLFFRRYAEGAFEIVWYGVPPDRVR